MGVSAVVAAGDRGAARAVTGQAKVYLELGGRTLVAHVVSVLQRVPEIDEVWVVGDAERLGRVLGAEDLRRELRKPLHVIPQFRNLFENVWETYRRLLPGAGAEGRDPSGDDLDCRILYLSADLPFATPQEISEFVRRSVELGCDYALGLVTEESMRPFYPEAPGGPGIRMAYFNTYEGRFRQSNLHLVKPGRIGNRHYIQQLYEHRYQKQVWHIVALAWRVLRSEGGGLRTLWLYLMMQAAGIADRGGLRRLADWLRRFIPLSAAESAISQLLRASLRLVVTDVGGCAVDIDNEHDYEAARARFKEWHAAQQAHAEALYGPLPLPPPGGPGGPDPPG